MKKVTISEQFITGMSAQQCHICGKYICSERITAIPRSLAGHLKMHVRNGEARRETVWRNNRGRGRSVATYVKVTERPAPTPTPTEDRYVLITLDQCKPFEYGILDTVGEAFGCGYYKFSEKQGPMGGKVAEFFIKDKAAVVAILNGLNERNQERTQGVQYGTDSFVSAESK